MTLRIQPRRWQGALLAAAGLIPFTACGGATDVNFNDPDDGGSSSGGSTSKGGSTNKAGSTSQGGSTSKAGTTSRGGEAGEGQGGTINIAGAGGTISLAGAAGSGGAGPVNQFPCKNPQPHPIPGTGYEMCEGGFVHRVGKAACPPGGQCVTDDQCGPSALCVCQGNGSGVCETSTCESDQDCLAGFHCIGGAVGQFCGLTSGLACQVPQDNCAGSLGCGDSCSACVNTSIGRACTPCCAVGRPFLVGGELRVAVAAARSDWEACQPCPDLSGVTAAQRAALASYWRDTALLEHASIAAFARFALDLLSVGAPPELVEAATSAMQDETAHARACFALASAFAGRDVGPGKLAIDGSLDERSLEAIVITTVLEGCIGETVAALEAAEALAHATDPAVRATLARIAEDELRHAALAYRFVRWASARQGAALERLVRETFQAACDAPLPALDATGVSAPSHGLLSLELRRELRARVLRELVMPTLPSLLAA